MQLATILTLSYNSPDIYAAIKSVLNQDYGRIQYIIVDDSSQNFSEEEIRKFIEAHGNIEELIIHQNEINKGTVRAANTGLFYAKGKYVFNLSGDDAFVDSQVISDWMEAFEITGDQVMTAYRKTSKGIFPTPKEVAQIKNQKNLFESLASENFIFGCCTAYKLTCLKEHNLYNERYRLIEDHPAILQLLRANVKIGFFDRTVVLHRDGGSSSVLQYNSDYEKDADAIYSYEVAPYTKNPRHAKKNHLKWKRRQALARNLQKSSIFKKVYLRLLFHGRYPVSTLKSLLSRFRKV